MFGLSFDARVAGQTRNFYGGDKVSQCLEPSERVCHVGFQKFCITLLGIKELQLVSLSLAFN